MTSRRGACRPSQEGASITLRRTQVQHKCTPTRGMTPGFHATKRAIPCTRGAPPHDETKYFRRSSIGRVFRLTLRIEHMLELPQDVADLPAPKKVPVLQLLACGVTYLKHTGYCLFRDKLPRCPTHPLCISCFPRLLRSSNPRLPTPA